MIEEKGTERLLSLDVFRGITIAGMILVNDPGSWAHMYWPLDHADWHGWTPTDLIFPFFLFIVGVSITLAFSRRVEQGGHKRDLYLKIIRRTLIIYALGFFLAGFPYFNLSTIRLTGVLQRISVCYLCASIVFLNTKWRGQAIIAAALLVVYCALMNWIPVPGYGAGYMGKDGNLAAYLDRLLLGNHIWKGGDRIYDPEGLLSTIPALATTLCGILTGHWLRTKRDGYEKVAGLFIAGMLAVVIGWAWHAWFPINKKLWTSSYVLFTAGLALQLLALCYWLIDLKQIKRWALPFRVFGVNALVVFVLSGFVARCMTINNWWNLPHTDGRAGANLQTFIYERLFASWAAPNNASLLYAIAFVLVFLGLMAILYRRKIYIKV